MAWIGSCHSWWALNVASNHLITLVHSIGLKKSSFSYIYINEVLLFLCLCDHKADILNMTLIFVRRCLLSLSLSLGQKFQTEPQGLVQFVGGFTSHIIKAAFL